ncbi:MAG: biopolymer transporter ExbD [Opitutales bacterium]
MALYTPRRRRKPDINIVPLVDVLVVLIFFFLLSMQFKTEKALDITPPKMDTAGPASENNNLIVGIDKTGKYYLESKEVTQEELETALQKAAADKGNETTVLLLADQDTPLKDVTFVLDQSRKLKLDKVRLQTR